MKKLLGVFITVLATMNTANAAVVESFESGSWGPNWSSTAAGVVTASSAHDGQYGVALNGSSWTFNTGITFTPGNELSAWVRPTSGSSGRFYLGFGADASGASSLVAATNTGDIRFQDNPNFSYTELNTSSQTWSSQWYKVSVIWNTDGSAIGRLYGSDGSTLLNTVNQTGLTRSATGIALRGFGSFDVDTIAVSAVPEPETYAMLLAGLGIIGASMRRRKKQ